MKKAVIELKCSIKDVPYLDDYLVLQTGTKHELFQNKEGEPDGKKWAPVPRSSGMVVPDVIFTREVRVFHEVFLGLHLAEFLRDLEDTTKIKVSFTVKIYASLFGFKYLSQVVSIKRDLEQIAIAV